MKDTCLWDQEVKIAVEISPLANMAATKPTTRTAAMISVLTATVLFALFILKWFFSPIRQGS